MKHLEYNPLAYLWLAATQRAERERSAPRPGRILDMGYKHLLVHVDAGDRAEERIRLAATLARRWDASLTGLFAESDTLGHSLVGKRSPQQFGKAVQRAGAVFEAIARTHRVDAEWWQLPPGELDLGGVAAHYCRYADLSILGQPETKGAHVPDDFAAQVLLQSGRPVLLVPSTGHFEDLGRRVLVGWNGSREGARALHDALPVLSGAEKVLLLATQSPPGRRAEPAQEKPHPDIVRHLARHGVAVEYQAAYLHDGTVGASGVDALNHLLNVSAEFGADLVVMGARGRTTVPFPLPSRSTREKLRSMTAPVLLSA
jgi:nucleotide-binding universal stress UspA family protein